jgi:two-component system OmpR family response regulator
MKVKAIHANSEDDPTIGNAVSLALKAAAYAADWVRDGASAIAPLAAREQQTLLLDLRLPGRSGIEVLKHRRQHGKRCP